MYQISNSALPKDEAEKVGIVEETFNFQHSTANFQLGTMDWRQMAVFCSTLALGLLIKLAPGMPQAAALRKHGENGV